MAAASSSRSGDDSPLVQRYRYGLSLLIGLGLLVVASIAALRGHYLPCGILLTAGAHFVNEALGLPTLRAALTSWLPALVPGKESNQYPAPADAREPGTGAIREGEEEQRRLGSARDRSRAGVVSDRLR